MVTLLVLMWSVARSDEELRLVVRWADKIWLVARCYVMSRDLFYVMRFLVVCDVV